uniref:Tumor protein p53 inducible nuclear protein 2 n=1 Tax=Coturnix japonica TaxID=93934 RepID=A0A8C2UBY9_COTJA
MFQRLTSLFFSDSSAPEGLEEPKPFVSEEEEEDGWLIIELGGERSKVSHSCGAACPGAQRPMPTLPSPCLMDESWFVTPPPCFTAEEPGPDGVGSSPMEDLLIEHPSMSVYVTSTLEAWDESPGHRRALTVPCSHREVPEPRLERHVPHRSASLSVKAAVLEKVSQARRVQRAKQLAEKPWLSQKALQRQDRARQRPPRRARQRAGSFLHQPCQRHCNY